MLRGRKYRIEKQVRAQVNRLEITRFSSELDSKFADTRCMSQRLIGILRPRQAPINPPNLTTTMATNPQDDAERVSSRSSATRIKSNLTLDSNQIRLKRLAKLQRAPTSSSPSTSSGSATPPPASASNSGATTPITRIPQPAQQSRTQPTISKRQVEVPITPSPVPLKKRAPVVPQRLDLPTWENESIGTVFNVTLDVSSSILFWYQGIEVHDVGCLRKLRPRRADGKSCGSSHLRVS